jgi:hypothetical protein
MANRYRVRTAAKDYNDPGPDLLRPRDNAIHQVGINMGSKKDGWWTRSNPPGDKLDWSPWRGPFTKAEVLRRVQGWKGGDGSKFAIGRKTKNKNDPPEMNHEVLVVRLRSGKLPGVKPGAELINSLVQTQFGGNVTMAGGFSCKEYNGVPGSGWSDHAWGDAVDETPDSPVSNNELTDWSIRMGKERCMAVEQILGSKDGRVGAAYSPNYAWTWGGPSSHTWHVHYSFHQHYGRDPNCR